MREKLQTLPLAQLRELAKSQGVKGIAALRKSELIDVLCEIHEKAEASAQQAQKTSETSTSGKSTEEHGTEKVTAGSTSNNGNASGYGSALNSGNASGYGSASNSGNVSGYGSTSNGGNASGYGSASNNGNASGYGSTSNSGNASGYGSTSNNGNVSGYGSASNGGNTLNYGSNSNNGNAGNNGNTGNSGVYSSRQNQADSNGRVQRNNQGYQRNPYKELSAQELSDLDSGVEAHGILEVMPDGFGFIRCENFLPGDDDVYVAPSQIRRFNMKTGDILRGNRRVKTAAEKFAALLYVNSINGYPASVAEKRPNFEDLTPIFPNSKLHLETDGKTSIAMRIVDLLSPIGKGQRGMIVSPPKAGKTTLLKQIAKAITVNHPRMHVIILLIDERPEEVTDIKEAISGPNVEVIYSTFDELPDHHKRVSEMVIERAKRLVEHGKDVTILLDSITRLARAYNLTVAPSGRTLSGGLDPAALYMPKRFFGAARNMREGGSLTILATALVDTGSRMDDVIFEEFKGTGNMELVLDRKLSEKRVFPAIDILKSGTRRDDLLLTPEEAEAVEVIRRATNGMKAEESVEKILDTFARTRNNREFVETVKKQRFI